MTSNIKTAKSKGLVLIDEELCKGCGLCVTVCTKKLLAISKEKINSKGYFPVVFCDEEEKCTACTLCAVMCPDLAITIYKTIADSNENTK